jgi:transcriptional regulator with XRE-family HTH domain
MTEGPNALGEYLRARRELVTPEQAGVPVLSTRRVPGLRREEVAMLAGISADYYLRLEQGRDRNPSAQVLESLARVLQLDDDATAYLLGLGAEKPRRLRRRARRETVPPGVVKLVAALPLPAFVEGRYFDVLAANALATALSPRLVPGGNRLRDVFPRTGRKGRRRP